jgi:hypothetical protein
MRLRVGLGSLSGLRTRYRLYGCISASSIQCAGQQTKSALDRGNLGSVKLRAETPRQRPPSTGALAARVSPIGLGRVVRQPGSVPQHRRVVVGTVKRNLNSLRGVCNRAVSSGLMQSNPMKGYTFKAPTVRRRVLSAEEKAALVKAAQLTAPQTDQPRRRALRVNGPFGSPWSIRIRRQSNPWARLGFLGWHAEIVQLIAIQQLGYWIGDNWPNGPLAQSVRAGDSSRFGDFRWKQRSKIG